MGLKMKNRKLVLIFSIFLLSLFFAPTNYLQGKNNSKRKNYVKVIYFHGDYRCSTCRTIEAFSRLAVENNFKKEIKEKKVLFSVVNYDKKENKHYLDDFKLFNQALIIVEYKNGKMKKYKNCEKIWTLTGNQKKFEQYVVKEIKEYLKEL